MNSIFFNDDDIEKPQTNWKNSEVMRNFVHIFEHQAYLKAQQEAASSAVEAKLPETPAIEQPRIDVVAEERARIKTSLASVVEKLSDVSTKYGNEKVKYVLERAIAEIQDVVTDGEN